MTTKSSLYRYICIYEILQVVLAEMNRVEHINIS
jgi:hypothetical protein